MVKKLFTIFTLGLFTFALWTVATAQERVLLHIKDGKQEAIPLKKGENPADVISRLEKGMPVSMISSAGTVDTLRYFTSDAQLTTNFGWNHQDVALQYYLPSAGGFVHSFYWYNYQSRGDINKGTVRAWKVNSKLLTASTSVTTDWMGYYKDPTDGDGLRQPFKPATGDTTYYAGDTSTSARKQWYFDPSGKEAAWLAGGLQVTLDSLKWQGITLSDWGDSLKFNANEPFGFTLSNDSPPGGGNARMEILSKPSDGAPYHSIKYYETGRLTTTDGGWWLRGDYEWGMYTVVEFTTDRPPKIVSYTKLSTTLKTTARTVTANISDDNPGNPPQAGVASAYLKYKLSASAAYDSVAMTRTSGTNLNGTYTADIPAGAMVDSTVSYRVTATDVNNGYTPSPLTSYKIFKKKEQVLFVYNNAQYSLSTGRLIYCNDINVDRWSTSVDGTAELPDLLTLFRYVVLADGSFPRNDVYGAMKTWISGGTAAASRNLFFTSQDYGCFIQAACADTSFVENSFENRYLGVSKIGPQDLPPTSRPFKVVPQADTVTNYLIKYNADSSTTLWHFPTFELGFSGYPDAVSPSTGKPVLKDAGTNVVGVRKDSTFFKTMYVALDAGALQFRSDTSLTPGNDPKYQWIVDIGSVARSFMRYAGAVLYAKPVDDVVPGTFALSHNYPNPFNPSTVIEYSVPQTTNVEIAIFNILGQKVATLVNDVHRAGNYKTTWNGKDSFGRSVASGVYFYQMTAGSFESVQKMVLMK